MVLSWEGGAAALSPLRLPGGDRIWHAEPIPPAAPVSISLREARSQVMAALDSAVQVAERSVLPLSADTAVQALLARLRHPDLPVDFDSRAAELVVQSASLLAIVNAAHSHAAAAPGADARSVLATLEPLGRAGRHALAAALSTRRAS